MNLRHYVRELRELGAERAIYRIGRELSLMLGADRLRGRADARNARGESDFPGDTALVRLRRLSPFAAPDDVRVAMDGRLSNHDRARLRALATDARRGRILAFGSWTADFGDPIDWYRNPRNGRHWDSQSHSSSALAAEAAVGDVKLSWEVARFPQAFHFARAAAFGDDAAANAAAMGRQLRSFLANTPFPLGIHWNSGQELAIRWMAWIFAISTFDQLGFDATALARTLAARADLAGAHILANFDYVRKAVYNNHLLTEAWGLAALGELVDDADWRALGWSELTAQADAQIYRDGAYIQQSHNYHRVALDTYVLAWRLAERTGRTPPAAWRGALERSLDFLYAQQNPENGWLPNFGSNDGAEVLPLSSCAFADFRPTLQTVSLLVRGERLYDAGPWDEHAAWVLGPAALDAPLRPRPRTTVAFEPTGYYVLRAAKDAGSFATFRCGTLRDRFAQMDMLHVDLWWRGLNVLVDGGSYLYNEDERWHAHFLRTASHNTLTVDGLDQMVHHRRFKVLYWTKAKTLRFEQASDHALVVGEHYGFARRNRDLVHRRSVVALAHEAWIVVDHVMGHGPHDVRAHWLCGDFEHTPHVGVPGVTLHTPRGPFTLVTRVVGVAEPRASIVRGREEPPRGWYARHYGERVATPSFAVEARADLPFTAITAMGGEGVTIEPDGARWLVTIGGHETVLHLRDGAIERVS